MVYDPFAGKTPDRYLWVSATASPGGDGSKDHPLANIQQAIAKAKPGTAIMVQAGDYHTNVVIKNQTDGTPDKPIWLVSADGPQAAHIIATDNSLAAIGGGGLQNVIIDGFWTTGGKNGIQVSQKELNFTDMIDNIVVRNNLIENPVEDGVKINGGDHAYVYNNVIRGGNDEGIDFVAINNGVIANNEVSGNTGTSAAIFVKFGSQNIDITGNYVHNNRAIGISAGGYVGPDVLMRAGFDTFQAKNVNIDNNVVVDNGKAAIAVFGSEEVSITNNYLKTNAAYFTGIFVGSSNPTIYGTFTSHNVAIDHNYMSDQKTPLTVNAGSDGVTITNTGASTTVTPQLRTGVVKGFLDGLRAGSGGSSHTNDGVPSATDLRLIELKTFLAHGWADSAASVSTINNGVGTGGADLMSGRADHYAGGLGDDIYHIGQAGLDKIIEQAGQGTDTVIMAGRFALLPNYVENLILETSASAVLVGNGQDNKIIGNAGNDVLIGGGGANLLDGGAGNDHFVVGASDSLTRIEHFTAGDVVHITGLATGSFDALKGAMTEVDGSTLLTLADGRVIIFGSTSIASLTADQFTLGDSMAAHEGLAVSLKNISANGNTHIAQGTDGNDSIIGSGGSILIGGAGDDRYTVKMAGDTIIENAHGGTDTVLLQYGAYTAEAGIENVLVRNVTGAHVEGNGLANVITGDIGNDIISGGGGADILTGGKGADTFVYRAASDGGDHVTDFVVGIDHLDLSALRTANPLAVFHADATSNGGTAVYATISGQDTLLVTLDHVAPVAIAVLDHAL